LGGPGVREVLNHLWETGMAPSVRAGFEEFVSADADLAAAVLPLCDQPHVTSDVISCLVAAHRNTGSPTFASAYGGSFGLQALFGRTLFAELARLEGRCRHRLRPTFLNREAPSREEHIRRWPGRRPARPGALRLTFRRA
jgi:CTP:molybdopterin cytidylyltransferase MocA